MTAGCSLHHFYRHGRFEDNSNMIKLDYYVGQTVKIKLLILQTLQRRLAYSLFMSGHVEKYTHNYILTDNNVIILMWISSN